MKKFFADFRAFIAKGNVIDMAVAVIIGGAFGKIVTSLVNDIIMPLISMATGGLAVGDMKWVLKEGVEAVEAADGVEAVAAVEEIAVKYGMFLQTAIDFLIIALVIFLVLRIFLAIKSKFEKKEEVVEEEKAPEETELDILKEIRDSLKANNGK